MENLRCGFSIIKSLFMIRKDEFPFSLGGLGWQEEYKGFDIVVHVQKHKGISAYAFSSEKRIVWQESKTFGDKEELFQWGRSAIDRHLQFQKEETERKAVIRAEYYIKKGKEAALKAFSSAMYFSNIEGKEYEEALGFFQYELDKQFDKLK
jgi:hypothetical protein|nr:MAG TPA: hypothetical protein [Caudoviricetes sp.]